MGEKRFIVFILFLIILLALILMAQNGHLDLAVNLLFIFAVTDTVITLAKVIKKFKLLGKVAKEDISVKIAFENRNKVIYEYVISTILIAVAIYGIVGLRHQILVPLFVVCIFDILFSVANATLDLIKTVDKN